MPSPDPASQNENFQNVAWVVWMAMGTTLIVYGAVLHLLSSNWNEAVDAGVLEAVLAALAVTSAAFAFWFRGRSKDSAARGIPTTPAGAGTEPDLHVRCIVSWAVSESIAIYGLVLAFLSQQASSYLPFAGLSALMLWLTRPPSRPGA